MRLNRSRIWAYNAAFRYLDPPQKHETQISGSATITNAPTGDLTEFSNLIGTATVTVDANGLTLGKGELIGTATSTWTETADLDAFAVLVSAVSVTFTESADLTQQDGPIQGATTLAFVPIAAPRADGELAGSTSFEFSASGRLNPNRGVARPLAPGFNVWQAPISTYLTLNDWSAKFVLAGTGQVAFGSSADLSAASINAIVGATSITWTNTSDIDAKGELAGVTDLTFTTSATPSNAAADQVSAAVTLTFSEAADLDGIAGCVAAETVTFSESARLTNGAIQASTTVTFTESATGTRFARLRGAAQIRFTPTAALSGLAGAGDLASAEVIDIRTAAQLRGRAVAAGTSQIVFSESAEFPDFAQGTDKPGIRRAIGRKSINRSGRKSIVN